MFVLKIHLHGAEKQEIHLESGRDYSFGRGDQCDFQLAEGSGISRVHFRISEDNGQWVARVVSKFGSISTGGNPTTQLTLEQGVVFKLGPYDFSVFDFAQNQHHDISVTNSLPVAVGQNDTRVRRNEIHNPARQLEQNQNFQFNGNDEATRVAASEVEVPFVRIIEPDGNTEEITLQGRSWIAGREEGCSIQINDRKSSRRQFELSSTPQGYFIRDLGSSNGTLFNGLQLANDELKAIRSGDVIQVGRTIIHFEVRDPHFQTKLMIIPQQNQTPYGIVVQNQYEMINYPILQGPGGAVRVDGNGWRNALTKFQIPFTNHLDESRQKKIRFYIIATVAIGIVALGFIFSNPEEPKKSPGKANAEFEKLSPQQQQHVKETFILAKNLYMQQKLALAGDQLDRLHKILPTGYENSLAMAQDSLAQKQLEIELAKMEREKQRQEEIRMTVESTVKKCEPISRRSLSIQDMTNCLRPALDLDPENSMVRELLTRVQTRIDQENISKQNRDDYRKRVAHGAFLYQTAFKLEEQGEYLEALDAYRKHAESSAPDPENLKKLSHQQIFSITKRLSVKVEDTLRAAEAAYAVGNFKEALESCARAIKMDPRSNRAHELNGRYRNELKTKLREIYEESIISEGLGQIDEAKTRWTKIIGMDTADGEYYKKARNKLRAYGAYGN